MNTPASSGTEDRWDVVILGGGLAGQLSALALSAMAPGVRVVLVERNQTLPQNQTWCCQASELDLSGKMFEFSKDWFFHLLDRRWPSYQVRFPGYNRSIQSPYLCIRAERLARETTHALARGGNPLLVGESVVAVDSGRVTLASGKVIFARLIVDARGETADAYTTGTGYQKFLGWSIVLNEPALTLGQVPTLMDAQVQQEDGFRFVYVLPFSNRHYLVEDTYFSRIPSLHKGHLRDQLKAYLEAKGVRNYQVEREEVGILPMPWTRTHRRPALPGVVTIGYAGGFFHPGTGYSMARSALVAHAIAWNLANVDRSLWSSSVARTLGWMARGWEGTNWFARGLNYLAFRFVPSSRLRDFIFSAVYRLPQPTLARFYAGQTTWRDRLALVFAPLRKWLPRVPSHPQPLLGDKS